jgi:hypothetical protein
VILGFNSDVCVGDTVYHVQTQDRGIARPVIDTLVYAQGRVVHRRTSGYEDLLSAGDLSQPALQQRVQQQHRAVVEDLRAGSLKLDAAAAGIRVQLLNPASWLAAGIATLKIEVRARGKGQPVADVAVEVTLEGTNNPLRFAARTDSQGCAELSFPMPELAPAGAALVIRAAGRGGEDEGRYQLKPKVRDSAPETPSR